MRETDLENIDRSVRGSYVLVLCLPETRMISVGRFGNKEFKAGFYAYSGSALGGLNARLSRHLRSDKKLHWHIDYLLNESGIQDIIVFEDLRKLECDIAGLLHSSFKVIPGFGSSDCRCPGHLFFSNTRLTDGVLQVTGKAGLNPVVVKNISGNSTT